MWHCTVFTDLRYWRTQRLPRPGSHLPRILRMGPSYYACHIGKFIDSILKCVKFDVSNSCTYSTISWQVLKETFPEHTFLMNGLIMGIKVCLETIL